jgi:hypothetical protein
VHVNAYRLWELWQQMHYPSRGIPPSESTAADLIRLDGTAGRILDRYFCGGRERRLDAESRETLEACRQELDAVEELLSADAGRYFGRLRELIALVLDQPLRT